VQEYGCAALEQLVVNNNNNEVTSTEAGLEISVKWLKENEPSLFKLYLPDKSIGDDSKAIAETLKVNTFLTIPNLSRNYKSNISLNPSHVPTHQDVQFVNEYARQKECTLSQIAAIHSEMQMNEQNADIQEGLLNLQNVANDDNNEVTIAEAGGITTILSAMKFHSSNANKVVIADAEGITMILSAMKTHFSNANVQEYGCTALAFLAENHDENKVIMSDAGGITTILSAMKTHFSNANVQEYGCAALEQLVMNKDNNKITSAEAGLEIYDPSWFGLGLCST
jgi:hypothetical protein